MIKTAFIFLAFLLLACGSPVVNQNVELTSADKADVEVANTNSEKQQKPDLKLQKQFAEIAVDAKGKVGVAAVVIETGESAYLNSNERFAMQSVYKLPIAMAVVKKVQKRSLKLDQKVAVTKKDFVAPGQRSPIRDRFPNGTELTLEELIRLSISESDGTASDVQLRLLGGPQAVQKYLTEIGIEDMKVVIRKRNSQWIGKHNTTIGQRRKVRSLS